MTTLQVWIQTKGNQRKGGYFQTASVMKCSYSLCHFYLQQWHKVDMLLVHTVSYRADTIAINRPYSQVLKLPFQSKTRWAKQMKLRKGLIYLIHLSYILSMDFLFRAMWMLRDWPPGYITDMQWFVFYQYSYRIKSSVWYSARNWNLCPFLRLQVNASQSAAPSAL